MATARREATEPETGHEANSRPSRVRRLIRRGLFKLDQLAFPEAPSAAEHWQRVVMNQAVDEYIASLGPVSLHAAEISGNAHADKPWKSFRSLDFPAFDICVTPPENLQYDVVICEQVLEHVLDPWAAATNLRRLCAPGGHVIVTTPFLIKVHELPRYGMFDYWRFTPRGLRLLLERAGFDVVDVGEWGNPMCVFGNLRRWSAYRRWHSLRDERDVAVQVWAFGRNPA